MKTKGISFWEQHVERLVLGFALLVTAALIAWQFLGEPNAVEVGTNTISPGNVDEVLEDKAEEISRELDKPAGEIPVPAVLGPTLAVNEPVVPLGPLPPIGAQVGPDVGAQIDPDRLFRVASIPKPTAGVAKQWFDSFAPEAIEEVPELKAVVAAEPFDVSWSTVYFRFPVAEVLKQFAEPGPNNEAALPRTWYQDRVDFIDLKLEREEYVDSKWVNKTLIGPMLGRVSFRPELTGVQVNDALRTSILARAIEPTNRQQIIQPPFYATLNAVWSPPPEEGMAAEPAAAEDAAKVADVPVKEEDPIAELNAQRARLQKSLDAKIKAIKDAGCTETPPEEPPAGEKPKPPPSGGGGGGPGAGGAMGGRPTKSANQAHCKSLWADRRRVEQRLAKVDAELKRLGEQAPEQEEPKVEAPVVVEKEPEIINIWAHDLSVVPGKTYRYRMTVEVYNPLFARKPELPEAQKSLADQFVLVSESSDWTQPLVVEPPLRLFVTNAQPPNTGVLGGIGVGSAVAEVFRFHNGRWWQESFRVQPGDRIGGEKAAKGGSAVDYTTDWFVLDVVEVLAPDRSELERNFGATVVLQSLNAPETTTVRSPRDDYASAERRRLLDEVQLAELDKSAAAAGGGGSGGQ